MLLILYMINSCSPIQIGPLTIGDGNFCVMAGPCSIESTDQFLETAQHVKSSGAHMLRGGIFKLRTRPDTFQGLGSEAFEIVREVKKQTQMPFMSEVSCAEHIEMMSDIVDVFQVGSRNMYNYTLLKEFGKTKKPVLLKRGFSALVDEWIQAAEHIAHAGNENVILCERGIRTFEKTTRNTFDLNSIAYVKKHTHFPVIADPSHATGVADLVIPMSLAAAAAGADGIIVETHPEPIKALSDGAQSLDFHQFDDLMERLSRILPALEKNFSQGPWARTTHSVTSASPAKKLS